MFRRISTICFNLYNFNNFNNLYICKYVVPYPNINHMKSNYFEKLDINTNMYEYLKIYNKNFIDNMIRFHDYKKFREIVNKIKIKQANDKENRLMLCQNELEPPNKSIFYIIGLTGLILSLKFISGKI